MSRIPKKHNMFIILDVILFITLCTIFFAILGHISMDTISDFFSNLKWHNTQALSSSKADSLLATPTIVITPTLTPTLTPSPTFTPTPSPTPIPGDFTATYPDFDTGTKANYTLQGNSYRIAINEQVVGECVVFVADIYIKDIHQLKTAFSNNGFGSSSSKFQDILELAAAKNAIFAVSGDFCSVRSDGIIIRNGELLRDEYFSDICVLTESGVLETYETRQTSAEALLAEGAWQTWCFGPPLLENGKAIEIQHNLSRLNPRCAIGYYEPGHYCLIVADGRQKYYSIGMTLTELSKFCESIGCKVAYNLDGGMSAMMVFGNEKVNQPPDGGRRIGDILYIEREDNNEK